jgi:hypothetical protein
MHDTIMNTPRSTITGDLTTPEPDDVLTVVDPWVQRRDADEVDRDENGVRNSRPLGEYFERMRERGLLD